MRKTESWSEAAKQPLFELSAEAIVLLDEKGFVREMNRSMQLMTGYESDELQNKSLVSLLEPERICEFTRRFFAAQEGKTESFEVSLRHADGHLVSMEIRIVPGAASGDAFVYAIMRDITEQKLASSLIQHIAYHDTLTGLPNRTMFQIELTRRMAAYESEQKSFSVLVIRLDRLQVVTDSLGHNAGDLLIKKVSERLELMLQDDDHISRIGSNEFALLYTTPPVGEDEEDKLNMLYNQLIVPYEIYGEELYLQVRMGHAQYPRDGSDMTALLRNASNTRSMLEEKGSSWLQAVQTTPSQEAQHRLSLENDLRRALDRGEFELHYQPQYDIVTGRMMGVEALIRWRHGTRGLISPAEFIPVAEETGLIIPIGDWVLRTACLQWKRWSEAGYGDLTVSVNLSIRQFRKHNMIGEVYQLIKETGVNPACLEFEITESMAMDNIEHVIRKLNELRNLGIRISMDDFGTGYSSLNYLRKIPIHKLKIDQSFIRDITTDNDSAAIVTTIISMAKHLKLEVIAEGVETAEDLEFLQQKQCGQAQGYYFSRPLPVSELDKLLQQQLPVCV